MPIRESDLVIPAPMRAMYERFHFAPAVRAGDFLLCSGQLGIGPDGRAIADPAEQFAAAFEAVGSVLAEAGLGFADVVEMTTFHTGGMAAQLGTFMAVKDRYLPAPHPAWTAIGVSELAFPGALVEIRVTAYRAAASRSAPRAAKRSAVKRSAVKRSAAKRGAAKKKKKAGRRRR